MHTASQQYQTLTVDLGDRSYPIIIGDDLITKPDVFSSYIHGQQAVIVTNDVVGPLYAETLEKTLAAAGKTVHTITLPDGETEKNWHNLMAIFDQMLSLKMDRKTTIVALGGGVIGDMAGFAASTYMRGIPFIQVPTTLLAQVDSSVGGKTAINHPLGKNMIGTFYQPQAVIADTKTLSTLHAREYASGIAEIIKHGIIQDVDYFVWLEANMPKLMQKDPAVLAQTILRSCEIKANVVHQDEKEGGLRAILNFGHTFGHAIETGLGYGTWLHGEAVGCGMVMAATLSEQLGWIDHTTQARITALTAAAQLPIVAPDLGEERWLELMQVDKKNENGQIRFILIRPLGTPVITEVPHDILLSTIRHCIGKP